MRRVVEERENLKFVGEAGEFLRSHIFGRNSRLVFKLIPTAVDRGKKKKEKEKNSNTRESAENYIEVCRVAAIYWILRELFYTLQRDVSMFQAFIVGEEKKRKRKGKDCREYALRYSRPRTAEIQRRMLFYSLKFVPIIDRFDLSGNSNFSRSCFRERLSEKIMQFRF